MKIIILGASGMLGFALHRVLADTHWDVVGTVRAANPPSSNWVQGLQYLTHVDATEIQSIEDVIRKTDADLVINAIGVKASNTQEDIKRLFDVNSVFPRRLSQVTKKLGVRLVHFSSDGVFGSDQAPFRENDLPDANDYYGISKYLGESYDSNVLTLRTSIIGRSLHGQSTLVDWILSQTGEIRGYRKSIFSGFPANEIGFILSKFILPNIDSIHGLYHLASIPISKAEVIQLVTDAWNLQSIRIKPDDTIIIDRSLNSERLMSLISYRPPAWPVLINRMYQFYRDLENMRSSS